MWLCTERVTKAKPEHGQFISSVPVAGWMRNNGTMQFSLLVLSYSVFVCSSSWTTRAYQQQCLRNFLSFRFPHSVRYSFCPLSLSLSLSVSLSLFFHSGVTEGLRLHWDHPDTDYFSYLFFFFFFFFFCYRLCPAQGRTASLPSMSVEQPSSNARTQHHHSVH